MRIRDLTHVRIDVVDVPSSGGSLHGLYYHAGGPPATCVVICHGYSSSKHNVDPLAFALAADGFAAFAFDFQGHKLGCSSRPLRAALDLRQNAIDAVTYARTRSARVVLAGHSMGAATAIGAGLELPEVAGVIVMCTGLERNRAFNSSAMLSGLQNRAAYVDGPSAEELTRAMDGFTVQVAALAPRPTLFIAATKDALVAPSAVRELYDRAAEPKSFEQVEATHTDCAERARFVVARWLRARGFSDSQSNG